MYEKERRARRRHGEPFTALLHHVDVERLRKAYLALKRNASPGIDGMTWQRYGQALEANLTELHGRIHRGAYRALPSKRQYIPKADGRQRPLGIAALEDKIVQRAVVEVLNAIYEVDFLGFSYGFRPKRSQHDALDALAFGVTHRRVNWIVDADLKNFFQSMSLHLAFSSSPRRRPVKSKSQTACRTYSSASWSIAFDNRGSSSGVTNRRRLVSGKRSTPAAGLALSIGTRPHLRPRLYIFRTISRSLLAA